MVDFRRIVVALAAALSASIAVTPAQAVVGGGEVTATAYPWLAAIGTAIFPLRPGGQFCAGVLIAPDRVLTAGHCALAGRFAPGILTVAFGRTDTGDHGGITTGVRDVRIDPAFRASMFEGDLAYHHDIAVLTLTAPVPLPTVNITAPHGDSGSVLGWGGIADGDRSNTRLRAATVPLVADTTCATAYGADFGAAEAFCAGSTTADTADFDSGGPLLIDGKVAGITSWAAGSARPGYPGVYARIPALDF